MCKHTVDLTIQTINMIAGLLMAILGFYLSFTWLLAIAVMVLLLSGVALERRVTLPRTANTVAAILAMVAAAAQNSHIPIFCILGVSIFFLSLFSIDD